MNKWAVAGIVSAGLHGFLLTQWPLPFIQVPIWSTSDKIEVSLIAEEEMARTSNLIRVAPAQAVAVHSKQKLQSKAPQPKGFLAQRKILAGRSSAPARPTSLWNGPRSSAENPADAVPASGHSMPAQTSSVPDQPQEQSQETPQLTPIDFARYRYKQTLRHRIERIIRYPGGQQPGQVVLSLTVSRNGEIRQITCDNGGRGRLEEAALQGISQALPFPHFPQDLPSEKETYEFLIAFEPGGNTSVSP